MVISRLNLNRIEEGLNLIGNFLEKLKRLSKLSLEEFLSDERNPASAESFLRRCIETIFDIGRHILAKSFSFKPLEYKEIARSLGEKGIVSEEYAKVLVRMAGYRNRMTHFYEITNEELYNILQNDLKDIEQFLVEISVFLKKYKEQIKDI
ncbi:DUF86 domain-containing protein [bacterium]|nr:DUF86 domain-containing protein [bacterium]